MALTIGSKTRRGHVVVKLVTTGNNAGRYEFFDPATGATFHSVDQFTSNNTTIILHAP